jgi:hypothetical protein
MRYIPEHDSYTILVTGAAMIPGIEHGNKIKKGEVLTLWLYRKPEHPADTDEGDACSMRRALPHIKKE